MAGYGFPAGRLTNLERGVGNLAERMLNPDWIPGSYDIGQSYKSMMNAPMMALPDGGVGNAGPAQSQNTLGMNAARRGAFMNAQSMRDALEGVLSSVGSNIGNINIEQMNLKTLMDQLGTMQSGSVGGIGGMF